MSATCQFSGHAEPMLRLHVIRRGTIVKTIPAGAFDDHTTDITRCPCGVLFNVTSFVAGYVEVTQLDAKTAERYA